MLKKKTTVSKGCRILLLMVLLAGTNMLALAKGTDSQDDPFQERADPFRLQSVRFRLALVKQNNQPNISLFTLAQRQRNGLGQVKKNFALPWLEEKDPRIQKTTKRAGHKKQLDKTLYTASLLSLTALNIADYFSTLKALQFEGLKEGNPFLRPFTKNILLFSALKIGISIYDFYLLKKIYEKNKTIGWILSLAGNFAMSYIVSTNIKKIQAVARK